MSRMTVFHHASNPAGHVAAVIHEDDCHVFYGMGFVDLADRVEPFQADDESGKLRAEIDQLNKAIENYASVLGGKDVEIDQLKQQLAASVPVKTDAPPMDNDGAPDVKDKKKAQSL